MIPTPPRNSDVSKPAEEHAFAELIAHPPERREQRKKYVVLYSCCCCCCCCLHTIGGAVGAILGGRSGIDDRSKPPVKGAPSGKWLYWSSLLWSLLIGLVVVTIMTFNSASGRRHASPDLAFQAPLMISVSIILAGPLWLLAASVIMAIQIAIRPNLPLRHLYWWQLGKITLGVFVGSVIGILIMVGIFALLTMG
jgi:hypothetical protein